VSSHETEHQMDDSCLFRNCDAQNSGEGKCSLTHLLCLCPGQVIFKQSVDGLLSIAAFDAGLNKAQ